VAIKKMQINRKNKEEYLAMEIGIMKTCQNPSIVRFIDSYRIDDVVWVRLPSHFAAVWFLFAVD
jgi:serine/threonine protein kinase